LAQGTDGTVTHGRAGLGSSTTSRYTKAKEKDRRSLVQQEVRVAVEEEQASRMVGMAAVSLDKMGACSAVERGTPLHTVPDPGCLRCTTEPIQPVQLGIGWSHQPATSA